MLLSMYRYSYAACYFADASGIRVTDSRYNGTANTGRTRSAARTVPKGREGRRDKRKESSYASRDADTTVRETRTVRRIRRERRSPRASRDRFLAVACTIRGVPVRNKEEKETQAFRTSGQWRWTESERRCIFDIARDEKKNWECEMNLREGMIRKISTCTKEA